MVQVKVGNLFDSKAQTLTNTVNCVGVMGKGIALEFKRRFPEMFKDYEERCNAGKVVLGKPYLYRPTSGPWILNFPTKQHWRSVSRLSDIEEGLTYLRNNYREWGVISIAVPPLGCGNGQLDWAVVGPRLHWHLTRLDIPVELYAPHGTPDEQLTGDFLSANGRVHDDLMSVRSGVPVKAGWFALVEALFRLQQRKYGHPIGRTSFQKLAYFATELGIPTGLEFERKTYGPHSGAIKRMIGILQNNGLIVEQPSGLMIRVGVGPAYEQARQLYAEQLADWSAEISKLVDLFARIKTDQAEIAATVHFAATRMSDTLKPSERDVLAAIEKWKPKKFDPERTAAAIRYLGLLGWINVAYSKDLVTDELSEVGEGAR